MPKLLPERLTPASIVTYVLDKQAAHRFLNHYHYYLVIKANKTPKPKPTKKQLAESKSKSNKKYYLKLKENHFECDCGAKIFNIPWYIKRHYISEKHINFVKIHGDKIDELD